MNESTGAPERLSVPSARMIPKQVAGRLPPITEEEGRQGHSPSLVVGVTVLFADSAIRSRYSRTYASSPNLVPSKRIWHGLLRRIGHCSEELITRKDTEAFEKFNEGEIIPKPFRFEITYRIQKIETGEWADRTFHSYQKPASDQERRQRGHSLYLTG